MDEETEAPSLSRLPAPPIPLLEEPRAAGRRRAGRRPDPMLRVVLLALAAVMASGVSMGVSLAGQPSVAASLATGALSVALAVSLLIASLRRR